MNETIEGSAAKIQKVGTTAVHIRVCRGSGVHRRARRFLSHTGTTYKSVCVRHRIRQVEHRHHSHHSIALVFSSCAIYVQQ